MISSSGTTTFSFGGGGGGGGAGGGGFGCQLYPSVATTRQSGPLMLSVTRRPPATPAWMPEGCQKRGPTRNSTGVLYSLSKGCCSAVAPQISPISSRRDLSAPRIGCSPINR